MKSNKEMKKVTEKPKLCITQKDAFTLIGVNPQEMIKKYIDGYHKSIEVKSIKNTKNRGTKFNNIIKKKDEKLDDNPMNQKFYLNSNVIKQTIHTTNYDIFKLVHDGEPMPMIEFNCFYCRVKRNQVSLGFPIQVEVQLDCYIFHIDEPYYCNFNCLYSGLIDKYKESRDEYLIVEENIKLLFSLMHPNGVLTRAKDWRLHQVNHGTLTDDEFRDNTYNFIRIPSVILLPLKRQYIQYKVR